MATDPQLIHQARSLLAQQDLEQASEVCLQGLTDSPNDPDLLGLLGLCDKLRGDRDGALARFRAAVAADQAHIGNHFQLARLLAERGERAEAMGMFDQCLALDPNHAPARTLKARLQAAGGERDVAMGELKSALRADPSHVPALTTLAELLLDAGDVEKADAQASEALRLNPNSATVQMVMARVLLAKGHSGFAERCMENAIEVAPSIPAPRLALAGLLQEQARHDQALEVLAQARNAGFQGESWLLLEARSLRAIHRMNEALDRYEQLSARPDCAPMLVLEAAECQLDAARTDRARALLDRTDLADRPEATLLQSRIFELEGDPASAEALAATLHDSDDPAISAKARWLSTRLALLAGDPEMAQVHIEPLLERANAAPAVVWMAAEIAAARGELERAVERLEELLDREDLPADQRAKTHGILVRLLDRASNYSEAEKHVLPSARRAPFLGRGLSGPAPLEHDESILSPWRWANEVPDDGRMQPLLLAGWPGTGRDLLVAGLSASSRLAALPASSWPERRGELGLPANAERVAELSDAEARLRRRRLLRQWGDPAGPGSAWIEAGPVVAEDLPMLARVFPGTKLIVPRAKQADLKLYWQLNGFSDIDEMLAAWQRDQDLLARYEALLPLRLVEVALDELLDQPEAALEALCASLGIRMEPAMMENMSRARREAFYRPIGHWQHYPSLA